MQARFSRILIQAGVVLFIGIAMGLSGLTPSAVAQQAPLTLTFQPGRDGTQPGTVTLTPEGTQTVVTIKVAAGTAGVAQPAHIHDGVCPGVGAVAYPLTNVTNGQSTTTVNASLASLQDGNHSINIHQGPGDQINIYTACVDIPAARSAASTGLATSARTQAPAKGPLAVQAPAKGPLAAQAPSKAAAYQAPAARRAEAQPSYAAPASVRPAAAAPAYRPATAAAPRLPVTGNGGLMAQERSTVDGSLVAVLGGIAAVLLLGAGVVLAKPH